MRVLQFFWFSISFVVYSPISAEEILPTEDVWSHLASQLSGADMDYTTEYALFARFMGQTTRDGIGYIQDILPLLDKNPENAESQRLAAVGDIWNKIKDYQQRSVILQLPTIQVSSDIRNSFQFTAEMMDTTQIPLAVIEDIDWSDKLILNLPDRFLFDSPIHRAASTPENQRIVTYIAYPAPYDPLAGSETHDGIKITELSPFYSTYSHYWADRKSNFQKIEISSSQEIYLPRSALRNPDRFYELVSDDRMWIRITCEFVAADLVRQERRLFCVPILIVFIAKLDPEVSEFAHIQGFQWVPGRGFDSEIFGGDEY